MTSSELDHVDVSEPPLTPRQRDGTQSDSVALHAGLGTAAGCGYQRRVSIEKSQRYSAGGVRSCDFSSVRACALKDTGTGAEDQMRAPKLIRWQARYKCGSYRRKRWIVRESAVILREFD